MTLPVPQLDNRRFQDLVDEAKKRIPLYCPEWTDHNVSDPGITLIELFAWMTESLIYRLNKVPELHYIKLMELLGMKLQGTMPAQTDVTFWLSAAQPNPIVIRQGTEVSSTQTETERPIIFTTDLDFHIHPPQFVRLATQQQLLEGKIFTAEVEVFPSQRKLDDALYFGFKNNLSHHVLRLTLAFAQAEGGGVAPGKSLPYQWEVSTGNNESPWQKCEDPEFDTTNAMNRPGRIQLHLPAMGRQSHAGEALYWLRVHVVSGEYSDSPKLQEVVAVDAVGGIVPVTQAALIENEVLGYSDGTPGQRFRLRHFPVIAGKSMAGTHGKLLVEFEDDQDEAETWVERQDFANSTGDDPHYTLDTRTGEVRFGPAVRLPNGQIHQFGKVPPLRAKIRLTTYRYGGGSIGNIEAERLDTLRSSIPFVARVANRKPARGGRDAESIEAAQMRVPNVLRTRERAITKADFEALAHQLLPGAFQRITCIDSGDLGDEGNPGEIVLLVIPFQSEPRGYLAASDLLPEPQDMERLRQLLSERSLLTTRLRIQAPVYVWVAVHVRVRLAPGAHREQVSQAILQRLYQMLNPLCGGPQAQGWPVGRALRQSDVYSALDQTPGLEFIDLVHFFVADTKGGAAQKEPQTVIETSPLGVIASGLHSIEFMDE
ncbi:MAG: putative baseplate assembly protein [Caldilineaceae bacterium]|nr:putative baseplate assembly protein [Caldilineaceae bacterium]